MDMRQWRKDVWMWLKQLFRPESVADASVIRTEQAMARAQAVGYQVYYYLPTIAGPDMGSAQGHSGNADHARHALTDW